MRTLYHVPLSGHSHRALLFLSLLELEHDTVLVDLASGEHKQAAYLARNAFGEVPVLEDNGHIISDSNAILVYLARVYGEPHWIPSNHLIEAEIQRWLSVAAGKIAFGACAARLNILFGAAFNQEEVTKRANDTLLVMEGHLANRDWIVGTEKPTIADIALYSYTDRAPEGNIDLQPYANVRTWLERVEALPGFVPMPKSPAGLETEHN